MPNPTQATPAQPQAPLRADLIWPNTQRADLLAPDDDRPDLDPTVEADHD